jgi:hypothetical protein
MDRLFKALVERDIAGQLAPEPQKYVFRRAARHWLDNLRRAHCGEHEIPARRRRDLAPDGRHFELIRE